ncbi:MAG: sensor histidine kinase [Spirochaetia bacterium]|nr:sensor histidine kinase [Spirochaetia bacterium]
MPMPSASVFFLVPAGIILWEALSVALKIRRASTRLLGFPAPPQNPTKLQEWAEEVLKILPGKRCAVFQIQGPTVRLLCWRGDITGEEIHGTGLTEPLQVTETGTPCPSSRRFYRVRRADLGVAFETNLPVPISVLKRLGRRLSAPRPEATRPVPLQCESGPRPHDPPDADAGALQNARSHRIAHDMRVPLAALAASREALQSLEPGGATAGILQRMGRQIALLEAMTHDVVRAEVGKSPALSGDPTADVPDAIMSIIDMIGDAADQKKVAIRVRTPRSARARIHPAHLERILYNLAGNALRHTPSQGRIVFRVHGDQNHWRVSVMDTGPGLPFPPDVFFLMASQNLGRSGGGFGIGLVSARALAHECGGEILTRPAKKGAHFLLVLPAVSEPPVPAHDTPQEHNGTTVRTLCPL